MTSVYYAYVEHFYCFIIIIFFIIHIHSSNVIAIRAK